MKTVIIDLDGICFDPTERLIRCTKDRILGGEHHGERIIDWDKAFSNEQVELDPVIKGAPEAVRRIRDANFRIVYLTGRSKKCLQATFQTLYYNRFPMSLIPDTVIEMRDCDDIRPDAEVKHDRIRWLKTVPLNERPKYYDFVAAIDDDYNGTLKPMYEALGIPCFLSFEEFFRSERWNSVTELEKENVKSS